MGLNTTAAIIIAAAFATAMFFGSISFNLKFVFSQIKDKK